MTQKIPQNSLILTCSDLYLINFLNSAHISWYTGSELVNGILGSWIFSAPLYHHFQRLCNVKYHHKETFNTWQFLGEKKKPNVLLFFFFFSFYFVLNKIMLFKFSFIKLVNCNVTLFSFKPKFYFTFLVWAVVALDTLKKYQNKTR